MNNNFSLDEFHIPRWKELPNINLYLDQVVNLINSCLTPLIFNTNDYDNEDSQVLTKTMINNYVKNNLIEPPVKKQYSKSQIAKLFVICVLKQVYSMQDIKVLIDIALSSSHIESAYDRYCKFFEQALNCTYNRTDFIDRHASHDELYLLKSVILSCSYKIYVKRITSTKNSSV